MDRVATTGNRKHEKTLELHVRRLLYWAMHRVADTRMCNVINLRTSTSCTHKRNQHRYRLFIVLAFITVFGYAIDWRGIINLKFASKYTTPLRQGLVSHKTVKTYICTNCDGGIGNEMFQFASAYGIAKQKQMLVVIPKHCKILRIFKISAAIVPDMSFCSKFREIQEMNNAVYDRRMLEFDNNSNVSLIGYLQAYRYFDRYKSDIKQQFSFIKEIKENTDKLLVGIFLQYNLTCLRIFRKNAGKPETNYIQCYKRDSNDIVTLIAVHVRRGDWILPPHPRLGFQTASKEYLHRAVRWYQHMYRNVLFIVATNGILWTKQNMPENISIVYLEGNSPEIDMAILTSCNHFIATTGTFSWWIGWLIGGNVTYFKWPARANTPFRKTFGTYYSDYFYTWWVGL